jgi:hypothetical protein
MGHASSPPASWPENTTITECAQESGHLQSTVLSSLWFKLSAVSD